MRILMWFSIGFAASCALGIYFVSGSILILIGLFALIMGCVLCFLKARHCKVTAVILLGMAIGVAWMWGYDSLYLQAAKVYDGVKCNATIVVSDYSYQTEYAGAVDGAVKLSDKNYHVRVYLDEFVELKPGDEITGEFTFYMTTPESQRESAYYQGKGIFLVAYAQEGITAQYTQSVPVKYFGSWLRREIRNLLDDIFPEDTCGFARALLLGDSSLLTYQEDSSLKISGIRHVIAVSGLHVSILFALIYMAAGRHRIWTAVFGIPVLVLFASVAGFTPSIVRACIMQSLMMLAMLFKKEYDPPTALAFAAVVMLAANPMAITSVSFQLSVGSMIGIFLFSRSLSGFIMNKLGNASGKSLRARLIRWLSSGVAVTLSAMTFTTPLVAWYFGMVSLVGVLTNMLTLWIISFVFYGIMFTCLWGVIWLPLGQLVAGVISWAIRYVLFTAKIVSKIPLAAVYTCSIYIVLWICVCYLMLGVFLLRKKKQPFVLISCIVICLIVSLTASYITPTLDDYRLTVFDVGEGQSLLIQSDGCNYLIDCGGDNQEKTADMVAQMLLSQGITKLDGFILTHYDIDHAGGIFNLLTHVSVATFYLPNITDDGKIKGELSRLYEDDIIWVKEDISLSWLKNTLTLIPGSPQVNNENESSLSILFQRENCDILITGDRGFAGEKALLESRELPELELLIAGHHGAENATSLELLSATRPLHVVISTGGRYGHPGETLLHRLKLFGCQIWRTDVEGTIIFRG